MSRRIHTYESGGSRWEDDFDGGDDGAPDAARRRIAPVEILFEHPRCLVVTKPAGLLSVPPRHGTQVTVVGEVHAMLLKQDPDAAKPLICHRLDRDTSGCLLLARDRDASRELIRQFQDREIEKTYVALVLGAPHPPAGTVEFRVEHDKRRPGAMWTPKKGGRACVDHYETLETFRGISLVRVRPESGRTHEVRLALKTLGTPCAVDPLYGSPDGLLLSTWKAGYRVGRGRAERPLIARLTLHAETLAFRVPDDDADAPQTLVTAPLPKDLAATLRQLRKHAAPGSL